MKVRTVEPEILDSLEVDDPRAIANRRDLRWLNFLMGNFRWIGQQVSKHPSHSWVEIGAGRGELARYLANKDLLHDTRYHALDLCPAPIGIAEAVTWEQANLLSDKALPSADGLIANLILHQFDDHQLAIIKEKIQEFTILIINEPARRPIHQFQLKLCKLLGFNDVSMHDGRVSINAGFINNELIELLGLDRQLWEISISSSFLGAYRLIAERRPS